MKETFLLLKEYRSDGELMHEYEWPIRKERKDEVFKFLETLPEMRVIQ